MIRALSDDNASFTTIELASADGTIIGVFEIITHSDRGFFVGTTHNLTAKNEVVLSAGVFGTPVILMHSGIGDSADLAEVGINTLVDLPSVGKNLTDHPCTIMTYTVNSTKTFDTVLRNETLYNELLTEWEENKTGLFADKTINHAAYLRLADNSTVWDQFPDPATGKDSAHFELLFWVRRI